MATEAQPVKKDKIPELQLVRAMAIIGVLSVHSTSAATTAMVDSNYYFLYNFINIFMKFGTPTFILLSSFVLFYNYYNRPLNKSLLATFYSRRLLYIVTPYVLFSLFYFGLKNYGVILTQPMQTAEQFFNLLLTGKAHTHLYFVFISIQFYVLFPLILWLFKKSRGLAKWAVPIGLTIQWGFVLINKYVVPYPGVPNKGSWAFSYMAYFMLGAFMGIFFPQIKRWILIARENVSPGKIALWIGLWAFWLTAGICHVLIWYYYRVDNETPYNSLAFEFLWNAHTYACALVLLQIAHLLYKNSSRLLVRPMERLGEISFGVYLIHPFFLHVYRKLAYTGGSSILLHAWYVGGFLLALIGSWIVVSLVTRFLPFSWLIFGQVPKPKRDRQTPAQPVVPGGIGR
ncbi:acyltransferase [Paenibacillus sambharensis]|uniref:Acyltransferase n=1 Tax=Paenibacillus sambharensis TaxID=1803190 RepID=A0A2W1L9D3_9BACL|nr:acyltransferase [Paenibacillus sambharensis]PZD95369.1 acyltransferase [Paenibacillus sambharensis]